MFIVSKIYDDNRVYILHDFINKWFIRNEVSSFSINVLIIFNKLFPSVHTREVMWGRILYFRELLITHGTPF